jgi:ribonuclease P protein subunit RPR2
MSEIVRKRIDALFELAAENVKSHPERSRRYVQLARKLSMRHRMTAPQRFKRRFCKICNRFWVPGYNVRVRINRRKKVVEYSCDCGAVKRFGYKG